MKMLNYALIGCGRIAPNHIISAHENGFNVVAVCDIDGKKAESLLKHLHDKKKSSVRVYTNYKEMLATEKLDLVAIATESGNHYDISMDCINIGCHVIIEKPIALDIVQADNLIKAASDKGVKICACHQNRFNKAIQKTRQEIEAGSFGKLFHGTAHIRWNRNKEYYEQAPWRGTWEMDGGALMNQCIHNIDLLLWMMGDEVEEVFAYSDNLNHEYIEAEDLGIALVKFKNGAYGIIEGTTNIYPKNLEETLYIFGETGTVKIGGKSVNRIDEWLFKNYDAKQAEEIKNRHSEEPPSVYGYGHGPLYRDMYQSITNDRPPYVDGEAGKRALELVLAIYKSAKTGKPVKLPLEQGSTLEFSR
jgi:predicted dehydrogenase